MDRITTKQKKQSKKHWREQVIVIRWCEARRGEARLMDARLMIYGPRSRDGGRGTGERGAARVSKCRLVWEREQEQDMDDDVEIT